MNNINKKKNIIKKYKNNISKHILKKKLKYIHSQKNIIKL